MALEKYEFTAALKRQDNVTTGDKNITVEGLMYDSTLTSKTRGFRCQFNTAQIDVLEQLVTDLVEPDFNTALKKAIENQIMTYHAAWDVKNGKQLDVVDSSIPITDVFASNVIDLT